MKRALLVAAGVVGVIVIAVAGYTGYWFIAAGEIGDRIDDWAEKQRAEGLEIESEGTYVSGFPLRFEVTLREPRIHDTRNGWRWATDSLRAEASAWDFSEVTVYPDRRNSVQVLVEGGEWRAIDAEIAGGRLTVSLDGDRRFQEVALDLQGVEVTGVWPERVAQIGSLQANGVAIDDDGSGEQVLKTSIAVRDAVLPSDLAEGLGESLDFLDIDASVVGSIPSERGTNEAITAWRDAGGTLELNDFRVRWGPLGIESAGTIALDGAMRPIAALTADIIGYGDVIDALIMSNMIPLGDAFIAKVAFNMLAEKPEDGGPPVAARGAGDGAGRHVDRGDDQGCRAAAATSGVERREDPRRGLLYGLARTPPSTISSVPVTNDAASDSRNSVAFAMSCGVPMRPSGTAASVATLSSGLSTQRCCIGVIVGPGRMVLERMPSPANWIAIDFDMAMRPALEAW